MFLFGVDGCRSLCNSSAALEILLLQNLSCSRSQHAQPQRGHEVEKQDSVICRTLKFVFYRMLQTLSNRGQDYLSGASNHLIENFHRIWPMSTVYVLFFVINHMAFAIYDYAPDNLLFNGNYNYLYFDE
jgi:hypothetical protein